MTREENRGIIIKLRGAETTNLAARTLKRGKGKAEERAYEAEASEAEAEGSERKEPEPNGSSERRGRRSEPKEMYGRRKREKRFEKIEKALDKLSKMWYNEKACKPYEKRTSE